MSFDGLCFEGEMLNCVVVACFLFMLCLQCTAKTGDVGLPCDDEFRRLRLA